MASNQYELATPPKDPGALELWLQHAAGRIFFEDMRGYAIERIDSQLLPEARAAAQKGIDDAVYGLMMMIDGVSGTLRNSTHEVELDVVVRLVDRQSPRKVVAEVDLRHGDGMCMGYHGWRVNDFGEEPIASRRPGK